MDVDEEGLKKEGWVWRLHTACGSFENPWNFIDSLLEGGKKLDELKKKGWRILGVVLRREWDVK